LLIEGKASQASRSSSLEALTPRSQFGLSLVDERVEDSRDVDEVREIILMIWV